MMLLARISANSQQALKANWDDEEGDGDVPMTISKPPAAVPVAASAPKPNIAATTNGHVNGKANRNSKRQASARGKQGHKRKSSALD